MSAQKFVKKPVVIEAIQWDGSDECYQSMVSAWGDQFKTTTFLQPSTNYFMIQTLEGQMTANKTDWVIKGLKGEFYPCRQDIFVQSYDTFILPGDE